MVVQAKQVKDGLLLTGWSHNLLLENIGKANTVIYGTFKRIAKFTDGDFFSSRLQNGQVIVCMEPVRNKTKYH